MAKCRGIWYWLLFSISMFIACRWSKVWKSFWGLFVQLCEILQLYALFSDLLVLGRSLPSLASKRCVYNFLLYLFASLNAEIMSDFFHLSWIFPVSNICIKIFVNFFASLPRHLSQILFVHLWYHRNQKFCCFLIFWIFGRPLLLEKVVHHLHLFSFAWLWYFHYFLISHRVLNNIWYLAISFISALFLLLHLCGMLSMFFWSFVVLQFFDVSSF